MQYGRNPKALTVQAGVITVEPGKRMATLACRVCGTLVDAAATRCASCGMPTEAPRASGPSLQVASERLARAAEERRIVTVLFADLSGSTQLAERLDPEDMRAILSDLFDATERSVPALKMLRGRRHDVLLFHLLDREELDFPFDDPTRFLSMEDERQIDAQPRQIRESYLQELRRFLDDTRRELTRADVEYVQVATDRAPDRVLLELLARREGSA